MERIKLFEGAGAASTTWRLLVDGRWKLAVWDAGAAIACGEDVGGGYQREGALDLPVGGGGGW